MEVEMAYISRVDIQKRPQSVYCLGSLDRYLGIRGTQVLYGDIRELLLCLDLLHPVKDLILIRRVNYKKVAVDIELVDDCVVDDPAVLPAKERILALSVGYALDIVCHYELDEIDSAVSGDLDLAHVAYIEKAAGTADRLVFIYNAGVLHRHLPTCKGDHPGSERYVYVI